MRGVLYVATDQQYFEEAEISAKSLKKSNPGLDITCISDKERKSDVFDNIIVRNSKKGSDKVYYLDESPYDQTIFFDTDIYVTDNVEELYGVIPNFDISLALSPERLTFDKEGNKNSIKSVPKCFPELNTGVIVYENNDEFKEFMKTVREIYGRRKEKHEESALDQPAFREALFKEDLSIAPLPTEYNARLNTAGVVTEKLKIAHCRLIEVTGKERGRPMKLEYKEAVEEINRLDGMRMFFYNKGKIKVLKRKQSLLKLGKNALKRYGIKETLYRTLKRIKNRDIRFDQI